MLEGDVRGHFSHGMNRIDMYLKAIESGKCDPKALPKVLKETPSTASVDANNGLGCHIGKFCMEKAIEKALVTGVGWVTCKNANHKGVEAYYIMLAIKKGKFFRRFKMRFLIENSSASYQFKLFTITSCIHINQISNNLSE